MIHIQFSYLFSIIIHHVNLLMRSGGVEEEGIKKEKVNYLMDFYFIFACLMGQWPLIANYTLCSLTNHKLLRLVISLMSNTQHK